MGGLELPGSLGEFAGEGGQLCAVVPQARVLKFQLLGQRARGGNVRCGADHTQRPSVFCTLDYLAAAQNPFVASVFAADTVFGFIERGLLIEMRLHRGLHVRKIVGMETGIAFLDAILWSVVGIA